MSSTEENSQLAPCYIIPNNFSYRISFCTGGKNSSVYTTTSRFVSPALFLICIVKILLFSQNYSKVLHRSVPGFLFALDFPGTAHTGLLFVPPTKRSDFCSVGRTGLQWRNVNNSLIRYENCDAPMLSGIV